MMLLLDTSGLLPLIDHTQRDHRAAVFHFSRAQMTVTHSLVLAELVALADARGVRRTPILEVVDAFIRGQSARLVWIDEVWTRRSLALPSTEGGQTLFVV